jgi:thiamine monophosphate synthase
MVVPSLLAITPGDGRDLRPWIRALGDAGLPAVLLREADGPLASLAAWAERWVPQVVVHDRHPAARSLGLPVHLPDDGRPPPDGPFTASVHGDDTLRQRLHQGAAWVLLSPVWAPTSKPLGHREALGVERFVSLAAGHPVLALGGVTARRHHALRQRGVAGCAVLGDLFGAPSPEEAAQRLAAYSARSSSLLSSTAGSGLGAKGNSSS